MATCALILVMLVAVAAANLLTMDTVNLETGELVHGIEAQQAYRHMQESHAGTLDDERIAADASAFDHANELAQDTQGFYDFSNDSHSAGHENL